MIAGIVAAAFVVEQGSNGGTPRQVALSTPMDWEGVVMVTLAGDSRQTVVGTGTMVDES